MAPDPARWTELNARLADIDPRDRRQLTDGIADVYTVIVETPMPILQDLMAVGERQLTQGLPRRAAEVAAGKIAVAVDSDEMTTILDAARLLRAIEDNALEGGMTLESDVDEDLEQLWITADGKHFVIPRMTRLEPVDRKPFPRRALLHFRVLPTSVGSFRVRLHGSGPMLGSGERRDGGFGKGRQYGAAFFPGLVPDLSKGTGQYVVESLHGFDAEALIDQQLDRARSEQCSTIVWGELTMPEASIAQVRKRLIDDALEDWPRFRYLVAGSWHSDHDGMRNAAPVLSGNGRLLFHVFKWAKFPVGDRLEGIVPGDELHVLICEEELVTIAVCRDFLESNDEPPHLKLNVDVAIVPSMIAEVSERATYHGQAKTADTMRVRYGTRTLVVAQPAAPDAQDTGLVMAFPDKPLEDAPVVVQGLWRLTSLESS